jgi:hypothetical protein
VPVKVHQSGTAPCGSIGSAGREGSAVFKIFSVNFAGKKLQISMEDLDVVILPREEKLDVNPNSPLISKKALK